MNRTLLSREELEAWIRAELKKDKNFDFQLAPAQSVGGITQLNKPDETGCNWSNSVTLGGHGFTETHSRMVRRVFADARTKFNVRWPAS